VHQPAGLRLVAEPDCGSRSDQQTTQRAPRLQQPHDQDHDGHTHKQQEEVYVVVRGSGRMKLDDEIVALKTWDVVRVPPGTWRGYEAGPEGLEILVVGAPNLGEDPRGDVEGRRDWWAD
jgi:mannose-6-phosphate isomerase-like protein (cupin superfamily)